MLVPAMLDAPPPDTTERDRAVVTEHAERIYDETKRDVDAEIDRLDAAKQWGIAEMDRVTDEALRRLRTGGDPDEVERWMQAELAATIERASAPGFDPRPTTVAAPRPSTPPPSTRPSPPAAPSVPVVAEVSPPAPSSPAEAPPSVVAEAPARTVADASRGCGCTTSEARWWWAPWCVVFVSRRRRESARSRGVPAFGSS